ncbi:MAG: cob(I)yrinic acid a,c-diamide adenosyltransferase, partial [Synergistetes bacterium HGW-Synergistetes-2]
YDLVVLDELNVALSFGLVPLERVLALIERKPPHVELVFTGRNPPQELIDRADLITEMVEIRHPYQKGILGRKGIDC